MAVFTIQAPDGRKIKVEAADEATALRGAQEWTAVNPLSPRKQTEGAGQPNTVTLDVNGRKVTVDSSFLSLSKEEQDRTVDEIWSSISGPGNGVPTTGGQGSQPTATLEQIGEALRRADAAGNVEDARALALAYRQLQSAGAAVPPPGLKPGSKEYAIWARDQALAGNKLPQVSPTPAEYSGPAPHSDIGSKLHAAAGSFIEGVPIAGPTLLDWAKSGRAAVQGMSREAVDREFATAQSANPIISTLGGITGAALSTAPLGAVPGVGKLLGMSGGTGSRTLFGAGSGAAISGADSLARGGSFEEAGRSALVGGFLGGALPAVTGLVGKVGQNFAQSRATSAAIANAPSAADLKTVARDLFKQVDQAGVTVDTGKFGQFVSDLATNAKRLRINPSLDTKAFAAFQELIGALDDVQRNGGALAISDLHTLRQIAQKAATSTEGRDAMFANMIVNGLDDFIAKPGVTVMPAGAGGGAAGNELLKAISTWGRARRVSLVEDAIERAKNSASGYENGLRVEFRKLLNNDRNRKLFTGPEIAEIEKVVRGSSVSNLAKLFGKFGFGPGANGLGGFLGGSAGFTFGGPVGAAAFALGASGARKASEKLTEKAANRAAKVVATPNIPMLPQRQPGTSLLAPAVLPLELTRKREPLQITVLGGNNSRL